MHHKVTLVQKFRIHAQRDLKKNMKKCPMKKTPQIPNFGNIKDFIFGTRTKKVHLKNKRQSHW